MRKAAICKNIEPQPPKPKPKPIRFENETMKDCKYKECRYRGTMSGTSSCDYCFITGYPRGCKISECTHALEDGETRKEVAHRRKQLGIY